jgi:hypothetical protein
MIQDGRSLSESKLDISFGLLDMHNDAFVELTGYPSRSDAIIVSFFFHKCEYYQ